MIKGKGLGYFLDLVGVGFGVMCLQVRLRVKGMRWVGFEG